MKCITRENYLEMSECVKAMDSDDAVIGSSNFGRILDFFEQEDCGWIQDNNNCLEADNREAGM